MRSHLAAALTLMFILAGCASFKRQVIRPIKDPPTLRTRPNFNGPHYAVSTECIQKVEWYQGWCEQGEKVNQLICHDVVLTAPPSCIVVSAK